MKTLTTALISTCMVFAAGTSFAQDAMKKDMPMTEKDCKTHMEMMKKDGAKKDDAMMKKDEMCKDMMMKKSDTMKSGDPMKK